MQAATTPSFLKQ